MPGLKILQLRYTPLYDNKRDVLLYTTIIERAPFYEHCKKGRRTGLFLKIKN